VNLSTNKEEENGVGRNDDKSRNKEAQEADQGAVNIASSSKISIAAKTSSKSAEDYGNTPAGNVIKLLQSLSLTITTHNHLVKVEGNAESPQEVGQEIIVDPNSNNDTRSLIVVNPGFKSNQESCETNYNADAQIHN